ncbi:oxidoreductase [Histoplasma capsulatum G186AR]|uniref:Oxidoreductase n=1 Tax=Ajellomyces capsulatus (strain G186AR / H82 / ATCC MYA-2454 / RMSCC 2432) TaxID=447093 RepID=C0NT91_AJECG|nr:oxidoreductase [Histoplasma capsulatum G186AR]EEH05252.1 oxidoreductase [Histoplasma capsulatum G186AR]
MATHAEFGAKTTATEAAKVFAAQIKGLTVLVTGVNPKGLGGAVVTAIAQYRPARIIITGRSQEKLDEVVKDLDISFPKVPVTAAAVDLASLRSVRKAAAKIKGEVDSIDVVLNNAGIMALPERELSENGFEMHLATNHIGHFLLTNLLMDKIRRAAAQRPGYTRIVSVTSLGYQFSPFRSQDYNFDGHPVAADEVGVEPWLQGYGYSSEPYKSYDSMIAYGQSKTANLLFTTYLAKHLASEGITSLTLHPGVIHTELGRYMPAELMGAMKDLVPNWKTQDEGAATSVVAAFDPALQAHSGSFLMDCQISAPAAYSVNEESAEKLWKLTERFVGQEFKL